MAQFYNPYGYYQQPQFYIPQAPANYQQQFAQPNVQQNMQQGVNQMPNNIPQNMNGNQPISRQEDCPTSATIQIPCSYVDSIKVVEATNADMTGKPYIYVRSDGAEIYRKQINVNDGASELFVYKLYKDETEENKQKEIDNYSSINSQIDELKRDLNEYMGAFAKDLTDVKNMVLENVTSPSIKQNGGAFRK